MPSLRTSIVSAVAIALTAGSVGFIAAQPDNELQQPPENPWSDLSFDEMMEMAESAAMPVEQHSRLKALVGEFTYEVSWMMPNGEQMTGAGTSSNKWILGGRFVEVLSKTPVNETMIESKTIYGFDSRPSQQHYFALAIDMMGTYYINPHGEWVEEKSMLNLKGTLYEEMLQQDMAYEWNITIIDNDHHTQEISFLMPGSDELQPVAVVQYERVK